jgi:glycosyltransferase involved in cell wall biosynthesis
MLEDNIGISMRILQVIPYFFLDWAGEQPVELIIELSRSLVRDGHDVTIYTTDVFNRGRRGSGKSEKMIDGVTVHEFPSIGGRPLSMSAGFAYALNSTIRDFEIIHIHEYRTFECSVASYLAKKNDVPYFVQAHGSLSAEIGQSVLKRLYDVTLGKRLLHAASGAIALTDHEASQYRSLGVDTQTIAILPNGVEFADYATLPPRGRFRRRHDIAADSSLVSYVGRLDVTKGLDLLLNAFADVAKKVEHSRLVFVGKDYGCEAELRDLARNLKLGDRVLFTGFVEKDEKISAYVDSDVFVTPSYNGFPRGFLEACASGTPIITTEKGDRLDWIQAAGLVVPYDRQSLAQAIARVLQDKELRDSFREEGRKIARNVFDWPVVVGQLEVLYERALSGQALSL